MSSGSDTGVVHLVGAGPGAASLLTLAAVERLAQADCVVYDRLCGYHFLAHVRPDVRLFNVGKRDNRHLVPQEEICELLVQEARAGRRVVRLKGGDPYVFGRGGEEADYLLSRGIHFEVIPGISSSIAVPAAAGIPVTHRDHCTSFHVITGHLHAQREEGAYDFPALARLKGTLVFLMGVRNLAAIVDGLIANGMDPETPAAVVSRGCSAHQREIHAPLRAIADAARAADIGTPAITVVGSVTSLGPAFRNGMPPRPLSGARILVTRTRHQAGRFSAMLQSQGAECLELPLIRTVAVEEEAVWRSVMRSLVHADWILFTSENAIRFFFAGLRNQKQDLRVLGKVRFAVVGPATAAVLQEFGYTADLIPPIHNALSLAEELGTAGIAGQLMLMPRAADADLRLTQVLRDHGARVDDPVIYHTEPETRNQKLIPELLTEGEFDWIPFASSSAVQAFVQGLGDLSLLPVTTRIACIGPSTAEAARSAGLPVHVVAERATLPDLLDAISRHHLV